MKREADSPAKIPARVSLTLRSTTIFHLGINDSIVT